MTMVKMNLYKSFIVLFVIIHTSNPQAETTPAVIAAPNAGIITKRLHTPVKVSKCCAENHNLELTNPSQPVCVKREVAGSPFVKLHGYNNDRTRTVDIQLAKNDEKTLGLPSCLLGFEVHSMEPQGKEIDIML